ncbi:hypothetical protein AB0J74_05330 [Asanoa sp. NPDC049573]|uniref:hypothetical protein n=1 Tax=Asanoa sp. NPDC049573 TaxID=3155396 RepID=UPI00342ABB60
MGQRIRRHGWLFAGVTALAVTLVLAGTYVAHADRTPENTGAIPENTESGWRQPEERMPTMSATARPTADPAPEHFTTLPPGAALPSGAQCATWVRARPTPENRQMNLMANATTGHHVGPDIYDDARSDSRIAPRVDGAFTGSTRDILRWAACKWGIDEDVVFAQAAQESWWRQTVLGDYSADPTRCAPGHGIGADGRAGQCPESFGILQDRHPYQMSAWPGVLRSTAMNADLAYSIWRGCFEGWEGWLNSEERGEPYAKGDLWGCVGRWFSGRWHTPESEDYIGLVKDLLAQRVWETAEFREP